MTIASPIAFETPSKLANSLASQVILDQSYKAVLSYAETQGYTLPSAVVQEEQSRFIRRLKNGGTFGRLDVMYMAKHDGQKELGTINFIDPENFQSTLVNSPTFIPNLGFKGDGVSAYIDTNFVWGTDGINYQQDSASRGIYVEMAPSAAVANPYDGNALNGDNAFRWRTSSAISTSTHKINQGGGTLSGTVNLSGTGLRTIVRQNSTDVQCYVGSTPQTLRTATSSSASNDKSQTIMHDSTAYFYGAFSLYFMGGALTDADVELINTAYEEYRAAVGVFVNFQSANLANWSAARANVLGGVSNATIGIVGDSLTAGQGAGSPGLYDGARPLATPARLAALLTASGINASNESMTADGATIGLVPDADMDLYEPRLNLNTASWGRTSGAATLGGKTFNSTSGAGTNPMTWSPSREIDTIDVWAIRNTNFGTFSITDASGTLGTQDCNGASAVVKKTVTRALSDLAFSMQRTVGNALHILGWKGVNSAVKEVSVLALGQSGVDTSGLISAGSSWTTLNCYDDYDCDLHFLNIGTNDVRNSLTSATYKTNLQTIVTAMKAVGDVVLVWPQPDLSSLGDQANRQNYRAAMYEIAVANNVPLIDLESYFTKIGGGASLYNDTVHLTAEGYNVVAQIYREGLAKV